LNGGVWHLKTPENTDSSIKELISWMHTEDKHTRPQMREVAAKLREMMAEHKQEIEPSPEQNLMKLDEAIIE